MLIRWISLTTHRKLCMRNARRCYLFFIGYRSICCRPDARGFGFDREKEGIMDVTTFIIGCRQLCIYYILNATNLLVATTDIIAPDTSVNKNLLIILRRKIHQIFFERRKSVVATFFTPFDGIPQVMKQSFKFRDKR